MRRAVGSLLLALGLLVTPATAQERLAGTVASVTDGDTIRVQLPSGVTERVRLIGIDTPETVHPSRPVGCYGPEASDFTKGLLPIGTLVQLELDVQQRDRYGRLLAYVWIAEQNVNVEIAAQGYALQLTIPPNVRYVDPIRDAVAAARENGRVLWSACADAGSTDTDYEATLDDDAIPPPVPPPPSGPPPGVAPPGPPPVLPVSKPTGGDKNCSDFPNQAAAQAYLRADPSDPSGLARDKDGIACESNRAPKDLVRVPR